MKKLLTALVAVFLLSACGDRISAVWWAKGVEQCGAMGLHTVGVDYGLGKYQITSYCSNGLVIRGTYDRAGKPV